MNESSAPGEKPRTGWLRRAVHFPVIRIVLFIAGISVSLHLVGLVHDGLGQVLGEGWPSSAANLALQILAVHLVYCGIVRLLEQRRAAELALSGAAQETGAGVLVGGGCLTVTVGLIAALGYYRVEEIGAWSALAAAFHMAVASSYIEEVIFRGVIFRVTEEALGTWLALGITVALFGLVHLGNPNASLYGAAAIGVEAGVLLGAAYVLTRRLWLVIGIHFGWNFIQGGVFGPNVSGIRVESLLRSELSGPELLSGGSLGVEGSVFAIIVCLLASLAILHRARLQDRFIQPFWRRQPR